MIVPEKRGLKAWNFDKTIDGFYAAPSNLEEIREVMDYAEKHSLRISVKGGGYSLGDGFLSTDNIMIDLAGYHRIISTDWTSGKIKVESGIQLITVLEESLVHGWYMPSLPGWPFSTVGGAVSCSSHGKDSWSMGNFGCNVVSLELLLASGETKTLERGKDDELLNAVIGGFGMLGIVTVVELQLEPLPSLNVMSRVEKVIGIAPLPAALERATADHTFIYAWIDSVNKGRKCLVEQAAFASGDGQQYKPGAVRNGTMSQASELFWKAIRPFWGRLAMKWANKMKYASASEKKTNTQAYIKFQYPWLTFPGSHLLMLYGKGALDFQNLFPKELFVEAVESILDIFTRYGQFARVCTVKMHRQDAPLFSFSGEGYSLSVDINFNELTAEQSVKFVTELTETVLKFNGKTYIHKFPLLTSWAFDEMYEGQEVLMELKARLDPSGLFWSDMAERLFGKASIDQIIQPIYGERVL